MNKKKTIAVVGGGSWATANVKILTDNTISNETKIIVLDEVGGISVSQMNELSNALEAHNKFRLKELSLYSFKNYFHAHTTPQNIFTTIINGRCCC